MAPATTLPIAQLQPGLDPSSSSVAGIVTLIWPYASSTRTLSLLLVEPDFRLRRHRGQVRVHFNGSSAKALSRSGVSSGDHLLLGLKGAQWARDTATASTPGKGIEWELRYGDRAALQILRTDQDIVSIDVDGPSPSPELPAQISSPQLSPPSNSHIPITPLRPQQESHAWASPAFLKRSHFAITTHDPFAEEELPGNYRRKRTKFGRDIGQWRFAERTPSPDRENEATSSDARSSPELQPYVRPIEGGFLYPPQTAYEDTMNYVQKGFEVAMEEEEKVAAEGPHSPPTTNVEPAEIEVAGNGLPTEQDPPGASPRSVKPSSAAPESDRESAVQNQQDSQLGDRDAAVFSHPASDYGFDGAAISRLWQTSKATPDPRQYSEEAGLQRETIDELGIKRSPAPATPGSDQIFQTGIEDEEHSSTLRDSAEALGSPTAASERLEASDSWVGLALEEDRFTTKTNYGDRQDKAQPDRSVDASAAPDRERPRQKSEAQAIKLEPKESVVEIIDLESEDGDVTDQPSSESEDEEGPNQHSSLEPAIQDLVAPKPGLTDPALPQPSFMAMQPAEISATDSRPEAQASSLPVTEDAQEIALRPDTGDLSSAEARVSGPQSQLVEVQTISTPLEELPSTIQDTYDYRSSKSQLMTPCTTQQSSFVSQASFTSLHNEPDEGTLPSPRLTQGTPTGFVLPEIHLLPASQETPKLEEPTPIEENVVVDQNVPTPQKPPTLIEKLKAMRKLPSQSARRSSDVIATSPWFAPNRSSQDVPDSEGESEVESLPENGRPTKVRVATTDWAPEKPNTLARSFIRSPSRRTSVAPLNSSPAYLPPSQPPPPGFRTNLSYFVPLAALPSHFTSTVDVLTIVMGSTPVTRATSGAKDYDQTIYITDPSASVLKAPIFRAQIFRPNNRCFPILEQGDTLLLRDFRVQSFQRQMCLLSTQSSSWAVFRKGAGVQMRGPPVELGAEERLFARGMWRWWDGLKKEEKAALEEAEPKEEPKRTDRAAASMGDKTSGRARKAPNGVNARVKKAIIKGLGVDLPGSQGNVSAVRKALLKERSIGLDGAVGENEVVESTEPRGL